MCALEARLVVGWRSRAEREYELLREAAAVHVSRVPAGTRKLLPPGQLMLVRVAGGLSATHVIDHDRAVALAQVCARSRDPVAVDALKAAQAARRREYDRVRYLASRESRLARAAAYRKARRALLSEKEKERYRSLNMLEKQRRISMAARWKREHPERVEAHRAKARRKKKRQASRKA